MKCCPECGMTDNLVWVPARRSMRDEPGRDEGWECLSCGTWMEDTTDIEARKGDDRRTEILEGAM